MTFHVHSDIWRNRFPLKHAADLLSISAIAVFGDRVYGEPLDFRKRLACLRFYFTADEVTRLHACLPRAGSIWSELGMRLAIELAAGGDGEYTYENGLFWPTNGLAYRRLDWRVPMGSIERMFLRANAPALYSTLYF